MLAECYTAQHSRQQDVLRAQELEKQLILDKQKLDSKEQQIMEQQTAVIMSQQQLSSNKEALEQEKMRIAKERLQVESLEWDLKKREEEVWQSLQVHWWPHPQAGPGNEATSIVCVGCTRHVHPEPTVTERNTVIAE